jgi:biotin transporter BioY
VVIATRNNRKVSNKIRRIKRRSIFGQIILVLLGIEVLAFASFTAFELPTANARNLECFFAHRLQMLVGSVPEEYQQKAIGLCPQFFKPLLNQQTIPPVRYSLYVPQVPAAIFIGYTLGWPIAATTSFLFLLLGLIGPFLRVYPFANGGGLDYVLQPGFGYLLGMIFASGLIGFLTQGSKRTSLRQIVSLVSGLVIVHLVGLAYLLGVRLFFILFEDPNNSPIWSQWLFEQARNLTWYALPYDALWGLIAIGIGFPFRWLVYILTAPDIALRASTNRQNDQFSDKLAELTPLA